MALMFQRKKCATHYRVFDPSFVCDLDREHDDGAIVRAIVQIRSVPLEF
ncbi:MAG: hypothetical protein K9K38_12795 [Rhodoferax sp.]|nr:hypothetical protein [Rhodoferax sp.]